MRAKICVNGGSEVDTRKKYEKYVNTGFMPAVDPFNPRSRLSR